MTTTIGKKISLITCGLLLSTNMVLSADTFDTAVKNGTVAGDLTLYSKYTDTNGADTEGFTAGTIGLSYETNTYMGLSAKAGFRAGHVFDGDDFDNDALMTEAYFKYGNENFALMIGRQEIDLEWLGDYNEAIVGVLTAIPDTTVVAGYVNRQAAADEDEIGNFSEITTDGAYVLDVKYSGIKNLELNPYFYSAVDVADFYGLKATYSSDLIGAIGHYAASNEDLIEDGSIAHVELSTTFSSVSFSAGYIKTDKDVGVGSISAYGDNISPFDEGTNTYSSDAKTFYASVGYSIAGINLGVLYGETDFASDFEETELNITADYSFTDSLSASLLYSDLDLDEKNGDVDQDYGSITITYSF